MSKHEKNKRAARVTTRDIIREMAQERNVTVDQMTKEIFDTSADTVSNKEVEAQSTERT